MKIIKIEITLADRDVGTDAAVTFQRGWPWWRREETVIYSCIRANPISGGQWAGPDGPLSVFDPIVGRLNDAAMLAVAQRGLNLVREIRRKHSL